MSNDATHDIAQYAVVIAGYRLSGFADADAFDFTAASDRFSMLVGNYGLGAWAKINNRSATGNFYLLATSSDNIVLDTILNADDVAPGGILVPMVILQTNGIFSAAASIRFHRSPDVARGVSVPTTTWQWSTTRMFTVQGGGIPTPLVTSIAAAQALIANATPPRLPI